MQTTQILVILGNKWRNESWPYYLVISLFGPIYSSYFRSYYSLVCNPSHHYERLSLALLPEFSHECLAHMSVRHPYCIWLASIF